MTIPQWAIESLISFAAGIGFEIDLAEATEILEPYIDVDVRLDSEAQNLAMDIDQNILAEAIQTYCQHERSH